MTIRAWVALLASVLTLTACSTSTNARAVVSTDGTSRGGQSVLASPTTQTQSTTPSSSTQTRDSSTSGATPLSSASGSYTMPIYSLCGTSFHGMVYTLEDIPKEIDNPAVGFDIVVSRDCNHGGSIVSNPSTALKITPIAKATDGAPLVAHIDASIGTNASIEINRTVTVKIIWKA